MVLAAAAAFTGASVQSATGFGFALVLSPALFAVLEPLEAVWALLALGVVLNLAGAARRRRGCAGTPCVLRCSPPCPGLALGARCSRWRPSRCSRWWWAWVWWPRPR